MRATADRKPRAARRPRARSRVVLLSDEDPCMVILLWERVGNEQAKRATNTADEAGAP